MIGTAIALLGAAAISAGAQMYGSAQAAKGQKKAAAAMASQQQRNEELLAPYTMAGQNALGTYEAATGLKGAAAQAEYYKNFQTDPGWLAAQEAGASTVNDKYRLTGQGGGNVRAALYDYGQRNMLGAYNTRLSQIGGVVDTGRSAASSLAGVGTQAAGAQSNYLANAGMVQGQGITGAGNALAGGLSNIGSYNMWEQGRQAGSNPAVSTIYGMTGTTGNNAWRYFQ